MSFIDNLLSKIAPHNCLSCGSEGSLVCRPCSALLPASPEECYRCRRLSRGFLTCAVCCGGSPLYRVTAATIYTGQAQSLVWRFKTAGAQAAALPMAAIMADFVSDSINMIIPVPTATTRVRSRGYDQAKLLAKSLSHLTGIPWAECLRRYGQSHQVGSGEIDRRRQLYGAFGVQNARHLRGANLLLIDDVITTGATFEAAATALAGYGVTTIEAAAFSRPAR